LSGPSSKTLKMDLTEGSETSEIINQTAGNYPKKRLLYSVQGESLKSRIFPINFTAMQNHIYKTVLCQEHSQIWLYHCRFCFPMPQLTPDCDRVTVFGLSPTDGMDFNPLYMIQLFQMVQEIRISEDYCRSDIYVIDYANITLPHVTKMTPSIVKKFVLCAIVSNTNIFCVNNESRT